MKLPMNRLYDLNRLHVILRWMSAAACTDLPGVRNNFLAQKASEPGNEWPLPALTLVDKEWPPLPLILIESEWPPPLINGEDGHILPFSSWREVATSSIVSWRGTSNPLPLLSGKEVATAFTHLRRGGVKKQWQSMQ